jgi:hypothetical protein
LWFQSIFFFSNGEKTSELFRQLFSSIFNPIAFSCLEHSPFQIGHSEYEVYVKMPFFALVLVYLFYRHQSLELN